MRRRSILAALPLALSAGSALAAGGGEGKADDRALELLPIALPIVADGKLVNYVFVHLKLNLSPAADPAVMRAKEPWFRDAIVRAGHRTPFTLASDYTRVDEARLKAALVREVAAIVGPGKVASAVLVRQTPKERTRVPRPRG
jgi:hypothetical protein